VRETYNGKTNRLLPYQALLTNRNFRALFLGQFISFLGDRINYLALVGLVAAETSSFAASNSPLELSKISVVMFLPALVFSPFSGVLVDRWNTKRVLVITDVARATAVALIPLARLAFDTPLVAYGVVFVLYTLNVFFLPARSAIMPELVEKEHLLDANSITIFGMILATIFGSTIGGFIVSNWGWKTAFYLDSLSYFVSVAALAAIRYIPQKREASAERPYTLSRPRRFSQLYSDFREGWRLILQARNVRAIFFLLVSLWIVGAALHVRGIVLIRNVTGNAVRDAGMMISFLATGMLLGSYLASRLGRFLSSKSLVVLGFGMLGLLLLLFGQSHSLTDMIILSFAGGVAAAPILIATETILQESIPIGKRARVFGSKDFITKSIFMMTAVLLGVLGNRVTERAVFFAVGGTVLFLTLSMWFELKRAGNRC
jgi:MFS family permease